MPSLLYNAVALCHHFSFVLFPTFFRSSSMLSDYYGILSYCRRIVQSLFISAIVLCRQSLQYLQIKIRTMYFYTVPVSIIYNLYSIANHLSSILVHSVLMSHLLHNPLTPHQICFSFLSP